MATFPFSMISIKGGQYTSLQSYQTCTFSTIIVVGVLAVISGSYKSVSVCEVWIDRLRKASRGACIHGTIGTSSSLSSVMLQDEVARPE